MIEALSKLEISVENVKPWRMNLIHVDSKLIYIAVDDTVHALYISTGALAFIFDKPVQSSPINAIKGGLIGSINSLVSVHDNGLVRIHNLESKSIIEYNNNQDSTWGIALHSEQKWIAVSANSWKITLYSITDNVTKYFKGHSNNIPSIEFMDTKLLSCSIDRSCKIWDCLSGELIHSSNIGSEWKWCIKTLNISDLMQDETLDVKSINTDLDLVTELTFEDTIEDDDLETVSSFDSNQDLAGTLAEIEPDPDNLFVAQEAPNQQDQDWQQMVESETESLEYQSSLEDSEHFFIRPLPFGKTDCKSLVVMASKSNLYILDDKLELICGLMGIVGDWSTWVGMERMCFVEWCPSSSTLIIGNQRGLIVFVRVVKNGNCIALQMIKKANTSLLIGIDQSHNGSLIYSCK